MSKLLVTQSGRALVVLLLAGGAGRAENIPWNYAASSTQVYNTNNPLRTSSIQFQGTSGAPSGDSGFIAYSVTASSSASASAPDTFASAPFDLAITLTDLLAQGSTGTNVHSSDTVHFSGTYSANNVSVFSLLPGPTTWPGGTQPRVTLGSVDTGFRDYTVDLGDFTPPGQPQGDPGSLQAIVHITSAESQTASGGSNDGDVSNGSVGTGSDLRATPEPASALLAGLGLSMFVFVKRFRQAGKR